LRTDTALAYTLPYKPRANYWAKNFSESYVAEHGQKVPKGTKYILVAYDRGMGAGYRVTMHKTLSAAKKAGSKALGVETKARKNPASSYGNLLPLASSRKSWNGAQARKRIKRLAKGKNGELRESVLKKAFLYVPPPEDRQKISAYKLPIADVKNGRLEAVPRAISSAEGALDGARGGVDISTHAKSKARAVVKRYMAKVERANK
tara:strand:- start:725 stop:1339 length:615 start_codon:yes stop_codon:yes gene_type:complete